MLRLPTALLAAATLLGCATSSKPAPVLVPMTPAPPGGLAVTDAQKSQVIWKDLTGVAPTRRATWDEWTVDGPYVSLARATGDTWKGKLRGQPVEILAVEGKISGPGTDLALTYGEKDDIVVTGFWAGKAVRLVLGRTKISAVLPAGSMELTDMGSGMFNSYQGLLEIAGPPDMPQVALAILSVLQP